MRECRKNAILVRLSYRAIIADAVDSKSVKNLNKFEGFSDSAQLLRKSPNILARLVKQVQSCAGLVRYIYAVIGQQKIHRVRNVGKCFLGRFGFFKFIARLQEPINTPREAYERLFIETDLTRFVNREASREAARE